jgi:two-component system chemotaxis sensor kinase CheA
VSLRTILDCGPGSDERLGDPAQVIVFNDGDHSLGVVVDQILDVAEDSVTVRQKTNCKGLLGSGVIGKQVADFLDLNYVIRSAAANWFQGAGVAANRKSILVAEASAFSRGLIRSGLDMAGYRVLEAANLDEVLRGLEQQPVDVLVAALDLPPHGSAALRAAMNRRPEWQSIPILALADTAEQREAGSVGGGDFSECHMKFDRDAMLESVARLAAALAPVESVTVCGEEEK